MADFCSTSIVFLSSSFLVILSIYCLVSICHLSSYGFILTALSYFLTLFLYNSITLLFSFRLFFLIIHASYMSIFLLISSAAIRALFTAIFSFSFFLIAASYSSSFRVAASILLPSSCDISSQSNTSFSPVSSITFSFIFLYSIAFLLLISLIRSCMSLNLYVSKIERNNSTLSSVDANKSFWNSPWAIMAICLNCDTLIPRISFILPFSPSISLVDVRTVPSGSVSATLCGIFVLYPGRS